MARGRISAQARWFGVITALAIASSVASSWRPAPSAPPTILNIAKLLPPIFTVPAAQFVPPSQVAGCSGKAVAGNQFSITVTNFTAVTTAGEDRVIKDTPSTINFAGNDGDLTPEKFFSNLPLAAGNYKQLKATVSPTLTIKGKVTCASAVWGGETRTYYTDGTTDSDNGDPYSLTEAGANPVAAQLNMGGGGGSAQAATLDINFTVFAGGNTDLNLKIKNENAFVLWDLSSITPAVEPANQPAIKVFPGAPDASGVE